MFALPAAFSIIFSPGEADDRMCRSGGEFNAGIRHPTDFSKRFHTHTL